MASATGPSDARFETTAAWQAAETSNAELQSEVEKNAQTAHNVAEQAAAEAEHKGPSTGVAVTQLEEGLAAKTGEATAEGKSNVQGYVQQAKDVANSAIATASSYLPSSTSTTSPTTSTQTQTGQSNGPGVMAQIQSAAGTAVETAKNVLTSAQQTVQPHVERAINAAQPHVESAMNSVSNAVSGSTGATKPTGETTTQTPSATEAQIKPAKYSSGST